MPQTVSLAQAIETINAKQFRPGERALARYTSTVQPLYSDVDVIERRGVDLVALAGALERGLDAKLFGEVMQFRAWDIDEFNLFIRSTVAIETINNGMRLFLADPRHW